MLKQFIKIYIIAVHFCVPAQTPSDQCETRFCKAVCPRTIIIIKQFIATTALRINLERTIRALSVAEQNNILIVSDATR